MALRQHGQALVLRLDIARDRQPPPSDVLHWMLEASDDVGAWFALRSGRGGPTLASAMTMLGAVPLDAETLAWGLAEVAGLARRW